MKLVLFITVAVASVVLADIGLQLQQRQAANADALAETLKSEINNIGVDGYNFVYETSNGIAAQENGEVTNVGAENEAIAVRGEFQYVGPDGVTYKVSYIADENGFQPQGAHLPVARR